MNCVSLSDVKEFLLLLKRKYYITPWRSRGKFFINQKKMSIIIFFAYTILERIYAISLNNMITDYFEYKEVTSVVGYSCNDQRDNVLVIRHFSNINIRSIVYSEGDEPISPRIKSDGYCKLGIFLETECFSTKTIKSIFSVATDHRIYDDLHYWLVIGNNLTKIMDEIDDFAFGVSTDFIIAISRSSLDFELYDIYNVFKERGTVLETTYFGKWSYESRLVVNLTEPKIKRRANLHNLVLKVGYFKLSNKKPNESVDDYLESQYQPFHDGRSKFGFHVIKYLSDMYNFTYKSIESEEWITGDKLGPIARGVADNSVDLSGSMLVMMKPRTYLMKFLHQDWSFRTCFIFRNPQPRNVKVREILRPLADKVWYLLAATSMAGVFILALALFYDSHLSMTTDSFLIIVGALCQQGTHVEMGRTSTRITLFSMMVFSLLIYNYYSSSVVSARLDEPIYKSNDSLSELCKLKLKMASEWMVYFDYLTKLTDWETRIFYQSWLKVDENKRFIDPETGIRLVKKGGFAYHLHPEIGYPIIEKLFSNREICELMEVHLSKPSQLSFVTTLNSTYVEILRVGLTKITEVGLRYRLIKIHQSQKPRCLRGILSAASLSMDEFAPHLVLLAIGIFFTVLIFTAEIIIGRYGVCRHNNCVRKLFKTYNE